MSVKKKYVYNGPPAGFTLKDGTEVALVDGGTTKPLPESDPHVSRLVRRGRLEEAPPETPKNKKKGPTKTGLKETSQEEKN